MDARLAGNLAFAIVQRILVLSLTLSMVYFIVAFVEGVYVPWGFNFRSYMETWMAVFGLNELAFPRPTLAVVDCDILTPEMLAALPEKPFLNCFAGPKEDLPGFDFSRCPCKIDLERGDDWADILFEKHECACVLDDCGRCFSTASVPPPITVPPNSPSAFLNSPKGGVFSPRYGPERCGCRNIGCEDCIR